MRTSKILSLILAIIAIWILSGIGVYFFFETNEQRGTFGDMYGAINSLFSGLALAGVILTLILQQEELKLQREEIRQSTEELAGQKRAMYQQIFESNFFKLLEIHNGHVESLRKSNKAGVHFFNTLRMFLMTAHNIINQIDPELDDKKKIDIAFKIVFHGIRENTKPVTEKILRRNYPSNLVEKIISRCEDVKYSNGKGAGKTKFGGRTMYLTQYFDHLFTLANYVKSYKELTKREKKLFITMIKSQLSTPECCVIFFYSISDYGTEWRKSKIIDQFNLLDKVYFDNRVSINPSMFYKSKFKFYKSQNKKTENP